MENIKEGSLYKSIDLHGTNFKIKYGYYDDKDRHSKYNEPIPIFPDFIKNPMYTNKGQPFVTHMQDKCIHYIGDESIDSCYKCKHFVKGVDLIGICSCPINQKKEGKQYEKK